MIRIKDVLKINNISVRMRACTKEDVITQLVNLASLSTSMDPSAVIESIFQREIKQVCHFGNGVAIPHARTADCSDLTIVIATLQTPVDWKSDRDKTPVNVVVLVIGNTKLTCNYLSLIVKSSHILGRKEMYEKIISAKKQQEIYDILTKEEPYVL